MDPASSGEGGELGDLSSLNHFPGEESRRIPPSWAATAGSLAAGHTAKASLPTWDPGCRTGILCCGLGGGGAV